MIPKTLGFTKHLDFIQFGRHVHYISNIQDFLEIFPGACTLNTVRLATKNMTKEGNCPVVVNMSVNMRMSGMFKIDDLKIDYNYS